MAVPRAHDEQHRQHQPPEQVADRSRRAALAAAFAVVIAVGVGVLGVRFVADTEGGLGERVEQLFSSPGAAAAGGPAADDVTAREEVLSRANQFVLRINTYGPDDLDEQDRLPGYAQGVRELVTAKLAAGFEENLTLAEQTVAQAGYARSVELFATGLESLDGDRASVLVVGAVSDSYPDPRAEGRVEVEPRPFRYQVTLLRAEGEWQVDDFTPVGAGGATGTPADPAAPADPSDPSDPSDPVDPGTEGAQP